MNHEDVQDMIDPYVDHELDITNARMVENHLRACQECRAVEHQVRALQKTLRLAGPGFVAPSRLRRNVRKALRREAKTMGDTSSSRFGITLASAAIASLVLAWVFFQNSRVSGNAIVDEVIADHVRSLLATHLVDVPSSDQHTVKPWFNGRIDFAPEVRDFSAQGFPLVGGRLDYLQGNTVAALVYRRNQHPINVLIAPAPGRPDLSFTASTRRGYNLVHWRKQQMEYWAVSDLNGAELRQLAENLWTAK